MKRILTAFAFAAALVAARAEAAVIYTFSGEFTSARDANFDPIETSQADFVVSTPSPITTGGDFVPTSASITGPNTDGLFFTPSGQTIYPDAFMTGLAFVGLNLSNPNGGSGQGYYFFDAGALLANGTYSVVTGPITGSGGPGLTFDLGNAGNATLTVSGIGTPVPEPMSLALFGAALLGLGAARRRAA